MGRNAAPWIRCCFDGIVTQSFKNWRCFFHDDASTDATLEIAKTYAKLDSRFIILHSTDRIWAATGRWRCLQAVTQANPADVVVLIDADDWFVNELSLGKIVEFQVKNHLLACHGRYLTEIGDPSPWPDDYSHKVKSRGTFRQTKWIASHPRAFRFGLTKYLDDRVYILNHRPIRSATDYALFIAVLELAGLHSGKISEPLYVYNTKGGKALAESRVKSQWLSEYMLREIKPFEAVDENTYQQIISSRK